MNKKSYSRMLAVIFAVFVIIWAFSNLSSLRTVAEKLISILMPVLAGCCIAFILNIPLKLVERLWIRLFTGKRRMLRRVCSLAVCLLFLFGSIALMGGLIIPQIEKTAVGIFKNIPKYIDELNGAYDSLILLLSKLSIELPPFHFNAEAVMDRISRFISDNGHHIFDTSVGIVTTVFGIVLDGIFAIVIAVYILVQKERLGVGAKRLLYSIFSEKNTERIITLMRLTEKTFSGFVLGQLTEACILGALCFVGMLIFKIPFPMLISVMVGITALVPLIGGFIGAGLGAVLILFESPIKALIFVVFIIVLQQLEGNLIYPRVVGNQVGLPGLWVLVAVTVGTEFGIIGMLVAVPIASLLYTLVGQFANARIKEKGLEGEFPEPEKKVRKRKKKKNGEEDTLSD